VKAKVTITVVWTLVSCLQLKNVKASTFLTELLLAFLFIDISVVVRSFRSTSLKSNLIITNLHLPEF